MQPSIHHHHQNVIVQKIEQHCGLEERQDLSELSDGKFSESQDAIINVCSDVCSNTNSSHETSRNSDVEEEEEEVVVRRKKAKSRKKKKKGDKAKKKKGGKVKGTLETSVEIRNRMIGMSEAGLTPLSIALSINRSVRMNFCIFLWFIFELVLKYSKISPALKLKGPGEKIEWKRFRVREVCNQSLRMVVLMTTS